MTEKYPEYYVKFQCSASKCSDNCCLNWEIDIDEGTLLCYENCEGPLREKLSRSIVKNSGTAHFKLTPEKRCPFLDENNLCEIILNMGEKSLCGICREHPRFYNYCGNVTEAGLGLCCEEAAKLILNPEESNKIIVGSKKSKETPKAKRLFRKRNKYLSNPKKYLKNDFDGEFTKKIISEMKKREIMHPKWLKILENLENNLPETVRNEERFLSENPEFQSEPERLMHYFIYRHFTEKGKKAVDFANLSINLIMLLETREWLDTGNFTKEKEIEICKMYSSEIEYDDEMPGKKRT